MYYLVHISGVAKLVGLGTYGPSSTQKVQIFNHFRQNFEQNPKNSEKIERFSKKSEGNSKELQRILRDSGELRRNFKEFRRNSEESQGFLGNSQNSEEFRNNFKGFGRILRDSKGLGKNKGIAQNPKGFGEIGKLFEGIPREFDRVSKNPRPGGHPPGGGGG